MTDKKEFFVGAKCKFCGEDIIKKEKVLPNDNKCPNCCSHIYEWYLTKVKRKSK